MQLPESFTKVTPLSKGIAMVLFALLPFIGFFLGFTYANKITVKPLCDNSIVETTTPTLNKFSDRWEKAEKQDNIYDVEYATLNKCAYISMKQIKSKINNQQYVMQYYNNFPNFYEKQYKYQGYNPITIGADGIGEMFSVYLENKNLNDYEITSFLFTQAVPEGGSNEFLDSCQEYFKTEEFTQDIKIATDSLPDLILNFNADLIKPNLLSTADWKTVTFTQNIIINQQGDTKLANIEAKIPQDWKIKTVQMRSGKGIGNTDCDNFNISSDDGYSLLVIEPSCGDTNNEYEPITREFQKVKLITKVGNDNHDSYLVRYFDTVKRASNYGMIDVPPGTSIDVQKDKIYPNVVLRFEPDRSEQWLWTSFSLHYNKTTGSDVQVYNDGLQLAFTTADTIVSTLKLVD